MTDAAFPAAIFRASSANLSPSRWPHHACQTYWMLAQRRPIPAGAIRLNFNENPYGPSPKALAALADCGPSPIAIPMKPIAR